jgi:hypothetical protein
MLTESGARKQRPKPKGGADWNPDWCRCTGTASCSNGPAEHESRKIGGDEGTRTPDPRDANAVLFQLSYIPTGSGGTRRQPGAECSKQPAAIRVEDGPRNGSSSRPTEQAAAVIK